MTFNEFLSYAAQSNPEQRTGQSAFNALHSVRPDLADRVRGTIIDPFYDDEKFMDFLSFVEDQW
jgi:hypothetical protein